MRVFLAGSTGAIGRVLVPLLLAEGHEVIGLTRTPQKAEALERSGAQAVVADALDERALASAVENAVADVVIHQLTALARVRSFKNLDAELALTNRLRTEAVDTLIAAARASGARRFIAQSICGWPFAREGGPVKSEDDPLDPSPPKHFHETLAAVRYLETAVREATDLNAIALRYGMLYGPGTQIARGGDLAAAVRKRHLPIVGEGGAVWSFVHVGDAARATVAALSRGNPGLYNVVDDEPAPVASWLPALASALDAPTPRRVPVWLARLTIGEGGVVMMTGIRGGSNAKAKRELGWKPRYSSWRQGFAEGLG